MIRMESDWFFLLFLSNHLTFINKDIPKCDATVPARCHLSVRLSFSKYISSSSR